jgi:MFS transporter, putative metabolite:H+ symporter
MKVVNSGARLDRLPLSRFHWKILGFIGAGASMDAFDIYLAGGVMAAMLDEGFSDLAHNAVFVSVTFLGMFLGAGLAGYVGDRFGRRSSYRANLALFGATSGLACFAPNIDVLTGLRFVMGVGLGAELVVAAGALCEFIPPRYRGRWISIMALIVGAGLSLATTIGYVVIPRVGWRWMFALASVGALIIWILRKRMPESPRWLETVGRLREAEDTMRSIEEEVIRQAGPLPPVARSQDLRGPAISYITLFRGRVLPRTIAATLTIVAVNVSIYGFVVWLPTFLIKQGLTIAQSLGYTTLMSFGSLAGPLIALTIADRVARRKAIALSCLAVCFFGTIYPLMQDGKSITLVGFALVTSIYTFVALGAYGYVPELFPTALRLRGTGLAGMCGRAAAITMPYLVVHLFDSFGIRGVLSMVIGVVALCVMTIVSLRIETGQHSLEQISIDLSPANVRENFTN